MLSHLHRLAALESPRVGVDDALEHARLRTQASPVRPRPAPAAIHAPLRRLAYVPPRHFLLHDRRHLVQRLDSAANLSEVRHQLPTAQRPHAKLLLALAEGFGDSIGDGAYNLVYLGLGLAPGFELVAADCFVAPKHGGLLALPQVRRNHSAKGVCRDTVCPCIPGHADLVRLPLPQLLGVVYAVCQAREHVAVARGQTAVADHLLHFVFQVVQLEVEGDVVLLLARLLGDVAAGGLGEFGRVFALPLLAALGLGDEQLRELPISDGLLHRRDLLAVEVLDNLLGEGLLLRDPLAHGGLE